MCCHLTHTNNFTNKIILGNMYLNHHIKEEITGPRYKSLFWVFLDHLTRYGRISSLFDVYHFNVSINCNIGSSKDFLLMKMSCLYCNCKLGIVLLLNQKF